MYAGNLDLEHPLIWTVENILDEDECQALIERIEAAQPTTATINRGHNEVRREIRNNGRVILDDAELAQKLFRRVKDHLPRTLSGMEIVGANERLRFYRYMPGEYFGLHHDGSFVRSPTERSLLTFMIYLNDDFDGGTTEFPEIHRTIQPKPGLAVLFQHMILHEGAEVSRGRKYAIRSDILYAQR